MHLDFYNSQMEYVKYYVYSKRIKSKTSFVHLIDYT